MSAATQVDSPPPPKAPIGLRLIAGAKIAKGAALACLSLGVFDVIHKDLTQLAMRFVQAARISPENHFVELGLEKLGLVEPATLVRLGMLTAMYASIQLVEGLGLWFGAGWAEYMVVLSTGAFVPEECRGLYLHPTWLRLVLLVVNTAILVYVIWLVWNRYRSRAGKAAQVRPPA
ncbi:MAG TPA: DUF2127 domain-containing protein [Opitutaceae bacterium]|jgi:uncharacterized membrane protein (DUF2068 family)